MNFANIILAIAVVASSNVIAQSNDQKTGPWKKLKGTMDPVKLFPGVHPLCLSSGACTNEPYRFSRFQISKQNDKAKKLGKDGLEREVITISLSDVGFKEVPVWNKNDKVASKALKKAHAWKTVALEGNKFQLKNAKDEKKCVVLGAGAILAVSSCEDPASIFLKNW